MSSGCSERIEIEPAVLEETAAKLDQVRADLGGARYVFEDASGALQSRIVEAALDDFNQAWSQKREALLKQLEDGATALRTAAELFSQADTSLASGLDGGPTSNAPASSAAEQPTF